MTVMSLTVKPITEKGEVNKTPQSQRNGKTKNKKNNKYATSYVASICLAKELIVLRSV